VDRLVVLFIHALVDVLEIMRLADWTGRIPDDEDAALSLVLPDILSVSLAVVLVQLKLGAEAAFAKEA
jgi:hypothetical protein